MAGTAWKTPPRAVSLPHDLPIPYSPPLEDAIIPSAEKISEVVRAAVRG
jgi:pyruvate/2-oxoglutarate/acetoin dehydrogenase E1 component